MDYSVINAAISDIEFFLEHYDKYKLFDNKVMERLLIALLGYYLAFGPDIFKKFEIVLDGIYIYHCIDEQDCIDKKQEFCPYSIVEDANPSTMWDYQYDEKNRVKGAIPRVIYGEQDLVSDSLNLVHELSHVLEGVNAQILAEDNEKVLVKHGFGQYEVIKPTSRFKAEGMGMTELITIIIENHVFKELLKLDYTKIDNIIVKKFLKLLKKYKDSNVILKSYSYMSSVFKDLIDNNYFFELIKKYYYENDMELMIEEYNGLDSRLDLKKLASYAEKVFEEDFDQIMYYAEPIQKQLNILNDVTGFVPDNRIIVLV